MKEFIEKLISCLKEWSFEAEIVISGSDSYDDTANREIICTKNAIEIVNQLAEEYNNGWILCEKELPPQPEANPAFDNRTVELYLVSEENADYPFRAFWNGTHFTDGFGVVDVAAWQPLPTAYSAERE